ncbi:MULTISPECIES: DUF3757 domain-containing protein [Pseudomonas]|uniref:DUF3757 domain-containing protein n=1 Tax=Pseudomonas poae TaxID=200451 RepID=A0AAP2RZA1_9PSED|nr:MULTISPECIES: DUF3757 domain-containing protein [Pseudomonas]ELQ17301.1 hypothetical protein A986_10180 [Pseudomonas fluorescens BRIP34879]KTC36507.1 hypothetical protein AO260_28460 [Pseudomonas sp. ABAC21]AGE24849.1 hypothetical protein H045_03865 [Pseudomonas poae RE*1-1-14]MBC3196368.1 DUF3757 domain-containing protein [Pseudomonas poae]MCF5654524.1 DUF3757 domain-containing protein [Pseudomonas poae]
MIKKLVCLYFLMAGSLAQAHEAFGCPYPSTIRYVDGFFLPSDMRFQWRSSKFKSIDLVDRFVDRFIGAIFIPEKDQERENGLLDKCVYSTLKGRRIELRPVRTGAVEEISLTGTLHWKIAKDPLEQEVYVCTDNQPDNCSFTIAKPRL